MIVINQLTINLINLQGVYPFISRCWADRSMQSVDRQQDTQTSSYRARFRKYFVNFKPETSAKVPV